MLAPQDGTIGHVLVEYEPCEAGRAALFHALHIAREAEAHLTVASVATRQPVGIGCASCRANTAFWNHEMQTLAQEALTEAGHLLGPSPTIDYVVARGSSSKDALAEAAASCGADLIVVPSEPGGRLRRLLSSSLAEHLKRDGRWIVITPPASAEPLYP